MATIFQIPWYVQIAYRYARVYGMVILPLVSHQVTRDLLNWSVRKTSSGIVHLVLSTLCLAKTPPTITRPTIDKYEVLLKELVERNRQQEEHIAKLDEDMRVLQDYLCKKQEIKIL